MQLAETCVVPLTSLGEQLALPKLFSELLPLSLKVAELLGQHRLVELFNGLHASAINRVRIRSKLHLNLLALGTQPLLNLIGFDFVQVGLARQLQVSSVYDFVDFVGKSVSLDLAVHISQIIMR